MARADCPICGGSGWKVVERTTAGAQAVTSRESTASDSGVAAVAKTVWAVPCDCTAGDRSERIFVRARIPERYRHCDFENYETDNEHENVSREQLEKWNRSLAQAKVIVQRFSDEYMPPTPETGFEQGLLLMGPCGVGKTHLAVAALKQIVARGHSGVFYDYRELLKQIQDSYNAESQSTEMSVLEPVLKTEVLVLDDVGSSKPSAWALETVGHILNTRYNERRVTLLTSNFLDADSAANAPAQRGAHQGGFGRAPAIEDTLSERVGTRIRSRLYEMCRTVEIVAPDYRKEIRNISRRA
jgi:DNA replication protein DnaC